MQSDATFFWYEETDIGWLPCTGKSNPRDARCVHTRALSTVTHLSNAETSLSLAELAQKYPCAAHATGNPRTTPEVVTDG